MYTFDEQITHARHIDESICIVYICQMKTRFLKYAVVSAVSQIAEDM